jgi:hypothetical protein
MNTLIVGPRRFVAAASATVITAVSAWTFVSSSASIERDPFRFASITTANTKVRIAQLHSRTAYTCPNNPEARDPLAPVCLGG